jgi:hypothetical protein
MAFRGDVLRSAGARCLDVAVQRSGELGMLGSESGSMPRYGDVLCVGWIAIAAAGCSVPDLKIVEAREDQAMTGFVPRELPDASSDGTGRQDNNSDAGRNGQNTGSTAGRAGAGRAAGGATGSAGTAGAAPSGSGGTVGTVGTMAAGGTSGSGVVDAGMGRGVDAGPPSVNMPAPDEPNPCLVWMKVSSLDRAPENAVQGGLETTAGIQSRQYVCRVQPPGLAYSVLGKAIFGNGCLAAFRVDGAMKVHNQQNGSPFEVLTAGPGCTFTWQKGDNTSVPSSVLDLSDPPGRKLYACHGDFQGPLSSGLQLGGVQGAADMPPRYECWFESYVSPMQPQNPATFEVLVQAP